MLVLDSFVLPVFGFVVRFAPRNGVTRVTRN